MISISKMANYSTGIFIMAMLMAAVPSVAQSGKVWASSAAPVQELEMVRKQIRAPQFPKREFLVTKYGAVGDGKTLNTEAFNKAIDACNKSGGGRVTVPLGRFLTGAIHLKS